MKLVGVKEFYNITRAKVISAVNCCIVISLCATATFAVDSAIDHAEAAAQTIPTTSETEVTVTVVSYPEGYDPDNPDQSDPANTTESAAASSSSGSSESSDPSASEGSSETSASASSSASESTSEGGTTTTTTAAATTTTKETTKATTAETTKEKVTESEVYKTVYATTTVNVRKGPGTDYDKVKQVYSGDAIDVVAETSNGWYKTANGNYVKKSLTTGEKPKATATPKPKPKATNTPVPKQATATPKPKATATPVPKPNSEGVRCKITFYGPQKMKDGSYSKTTASGTTCTEGRTVAADWSIYPKGTVIYIENDPLGGDGYYTVEDKGGAVKGYIIDIYAEDGETGNHATCYRNVYVK
ncbi:MAG: SH3 domain-containing protein [Clostridiales bacterium]|nr:SH3 domain-containing protein [Clostridiales bacterium]